VRGVRVGVNILLGGRLFGQFAGALMTGLLPGCRPARSLSILIGSGRALFGLFGHRDGASPTMIGRAFRFRVGTIQPVETPQANGNVLID
jgi:hypothetical protein